LRIILNLRLNQDEYKYEYECPNCGIDVKESDTSCSYCGILFEVEGEEDKAQINEPLIAPLKVLIPEVVHEIELNEQEILKCEFDDEILFNDAMNLELDQNEPVDEEFIFEDGLLLDGEELLRKMYK
jgi:uncharacterized Zn finger protein (UPF0148 family)